MIVARHVEVKSHHYDKSCSLFTFPDGTEDPFLTVCLTCRSLPLETSGRHPDTFASVHHMLPPPDERWVTHAHTEIVEVSAITFFIRCCFLAFVSL